MESDAKTWNVMQAFVAITVLTGFFGIVFCWMVFPPKTTDAGTLAILNQLTGAVTTLAVAVVSYYVGSSKSSADKDETTKIATKAAVDQAAMTSTTLDKMVGTGPGTVTPIVTKNGSPKSEDK